MKLGFTAEPKKPEPKEWNTLTIFDLNDADLKKAARALKDDNANYGWVLQPMEIPEAAKGFAKKVKEVWRSKEFLVQIFDVDADIERLTINRTSVDTANRRWRDGITWDELQNIKREVGRGDYDAVEIFPADRNIVNVANMRHLWVYKNGEVAFKWRSN